MSEDLDNPRIQPHLRVELGQALHALGLDTSSEHSPDPPAVSDALPPGTAIGRFTVLGRIGRGGQGEVYSVYDPELDRRVALKRIRDAHAGRTQHARLLREAQALARLGHPNVVRVHETGTFDGSPYLVMEYKTSQSLAVWLSADRRTWPEILARFTAAGRGLHAAHTADIVHRDVKADNIFIDDNVGAVLGDFGLAYGVDDDPSTEDSSELPESRPRPALLEPVTETGQFPGTEGYMAPEAMAGRATRSSDQYSFCVALFHALFGLLARPDEQRWPPRPGDEPPNTLTRALHRGLARDPAARFPDIASLLTALAVRPRRPRILFGALSLAAVAGIGLAFLLTPDPCLAAAQADADAVWNQTRRAALVDAFAAVDLAYAPQTGRSFAEFADEYKGDWLAARTAACAAPSSRVTACLDHQRDRFDHLLAEYTAPTPSRLPHALDAATHLGPPERCRELPPNPPPDPPEAVRDALDRIDLKISGADYAAAAHELRALADVPDNPRKLWLAAWLAGETKPDSEADALLKTAVDAAARARDHDTFARAAVYRLKLLAYDLGELTEAAGEARWTELFATNWTPESMLDRWFRAELAEAHALRLEAEGNYSAAVEQHRRALDRRIKLDGDDHPRVAKSHHNLALGLSYLGDYDDSVTHMLAAHAIRRSQFGETHQRTLDSAFALAQNECEHFDLHAERDPGALEDCTAALAAALDDSRAYLEFDRTGVSGRAVNLAYYTLDGPCPECADPAIAMSRDMLASVVDADVRDRSDLLGVQAKRELVRHDNAAALALFAAAAALWEAEARHEGPYFKLLDGAFLVALTLPREHLAAFLAARSAAVADADCSVRETLAQQLEALAASLEPPRRADDLDRAAAALHCP